MSAEPMFLYGIFINLHYKTFASGVSRYLRGYFPVIIQRVPAVIEYPPHVNPELDIWHSEHPQIPGQWGAYMRSYFGWNHHAKYAYVCADTLEKIEVSANDPFKFRLGPYSRCNNLRSLEATMRYRGYDAKDFDEKLLPK